MTTTSDALRAAREAIASIREDDFASFTVGRDPETMEPGESAIIARYDAALSQIDAVLALSPIQLADVTDDQVREAFIILGYELSPHIPVQDDDAVQRLIIPGDVRRLAAHFINVGRRGS